MLSILSLIGALGFIVSGPASISHSIVNKTQFKKYELEIIDLFKKDQEIIYKNINLFSSINNNDIKSFLIEENESVIFDLNKLEKRGFNQESLSFLFRRSFKNTTLKGLENKGMFEEKHYNVNTNNLFLENRIIGQKEIAFSGPNHWYEYLIGYWKIHFNNEMSIELSKGNFLSTLSELSGVLADGMANIPYIATGATAVSLLAGILATLGSSIFESGNKGNGIYIRFAFLIPTGWGPSDKKWN
ncbi:hypothetical protein EELLY_v1c05950 [Entomoplasma ellychniae]|uniref:Uncharacterized protein n=1 Tax=Entomoplasma ellychniae TaxID=2114 RepID=A0A8E2QYS7_9MOLU|nr:hypothetical protein [Entomoplasma ellychniae]PPE04909.1 hypothetical protein EELLY_v1c05950 [Entomoplasma ellychniae]